MVRRVGLGRGVGVLASHSSIHFLPNGHLNNTHTWPWSLAVSSAKTNDSPGKVQNHTFSYSLKRTLRGIYMWLNGSTKLWVRMICLDLHFNQKYPCSQYKNSRSFLACLRMKYKFYGCLLSLFHLINLS